MEKNWIGDLAGPESSWQGKDSFKNKGWPTMMKTWGVLGTVVSGGVFGTFVGTATWGTGATIWNGASLGVGTYNTVDGLTNGRMPGSSFMNNKAGSYLILQMFFKEALLE